MTAGDARAQEERVRVFNSYRELFADAPIRLMSRTVSTMRSMGYGDLASAIGDLDWRTVPADDPEDPTLREQWGELLASAFNHILISDYSWISPAANGLVHHYLTGDGGGQGQQSGPVVQGHGRALPVVIRRISRLYSITYNKNPSTTVSDYSHFAFQITRG